jgi:hypothetical protein
MLEQIHKQLITTQILLESIVDELVKNNLIDKNSLDIRIQSKIDTINNSIDKLDDIIDINSESTTIFGGPVGKA